MKVRLRFLLAATAVVAVSLVSGPAVVDAGGVATYVVDTTSDASVTACTVAAADCSLRGAISNANSNPSSTHNLTFSAAVFPPGAPATITLNSTLAITAGLTSITIDGAGAGVIVDGAGEPSAFDCFDLAGPNTGPITIQAIQVTDCTIGIDAGSANVTLGPANVIFDNIIGIRAPSTGALIKGNFIGTNAAGTAVNPSGGNGTGVTVTGTSNTIGGAGALGNVISGNTTSGIQISADSNSVKGNLIGVAAVGAVAIPNGASGVLISTANVDNNVIGGAGADGNTISGNTGSGVVVGTDFGTGNTIKGNQIGTIGGNTDLGNGGDGIAISQKAQNTLIGGTAAADRNIISGNVANGIYASSGSGTAIKANYIGLGLDGSTVLANGGDGVRFTSGDGPVTVGGPTAAERNVISGNILHGIEISGESNGHTIRGNYIGTDANGTLDKGNGSDGVHIEFSDSSTIGGSGAGDLNVISGNTGMGLRINNEANNSVIHGNRIGTDVAGTAAISNNDGINISDSDGTFVGGSAAGQGNLISGNVDDGIEIHGTSASTRVEGNFIGTNAAGTGDLGNGANGIQQYNTSTGSQIGGASAAQRNIISGNNGTAGILMTAAGNTISGNYIGLNAAGTGAIPNSTGVRLSGINNTVGGLTGGSGNVISGNSDNGIEIASTGNSVRGNIIGLTAAGTGALGNTLSGIRITAANNTIGGSTTATRNVISRNSLHGVEIAGDTSDSNDILGNYIGTGANGTTDLGNLLDGVHIDAGDSNTIGGPTSSSRNVISGNNSDGIELSNDANNNTVFENYIGTSANGMADVGNSAIGVNVISSDNNTIGDGGDGNVLSGNNQDGAEITSASLGNIVQGNLMGVAADGVSPLGNGTNGIQIAGSSSNTSVGGNVAFQANHIAYNTGDGITISSGTGNLIDQNSIHDNGAFGIDLANDNIVTPNDAAPDADAGANNLQNFPVLTVAVSPTTSTVVVGTLTSAPLTPFTLRFFHSATCDPSGNGEGEVFLGSLGVVTNAAGVIGFGPTFGAVGGLRYVTATATDAAGNTSEFSNCVQVPAIIVNSNADPGDGVCNGTECTLREAITAANADPDPDVIRLAISSGVQTIVPASSLPTISQPVVIDGTSQPGFAGTPIIELNGTSAPGPGLNITSGGSTVRGLVINRFSGDGITLQTGDGNVIEGNYLGTDVVGAADLGNNARGVSIELGSLSNTIGGDTAGERNVISGNNQGGVFIAANSNVQLVSGNYIGTNAAGNAAIANGSQAGIQVNSSSNTIGGSAAGQGNLVSGNAAGISLNGAFNEVLGNLIGTDATGSVDLGNTTSGVFVSGTDHLIGGTTAGARNVISGNNAEGIRLSGAIGNTVFGNYIGTNASGTASLGNSLDGVNIGTSSTGNTVGGATAGARNVISGNGRDGVSISGGPSTGNQVLGNFIGTDVTGTLDRGNVGDGVDISGSPNTVIGGVAAGARNVISGNGGHGVNMFEGGTTQILGNHIGTDVASAALGNGGAGINLVDSPSNTIGGDAVGAANTIAHNSLDGVQVSGSLGTGDAIATNSIHSNGGLGIDLAPDGVTSNDAGDADTGPNGLQNFPILTSAGLANGLIAINGSFNSTASTSFTIRYYVSAVCDPSGKGEGETKVEVGGLNTDGAGNAAIAILLDSTPVSGTFITATATNPANNTSEFSNCVPVLDDADDDNDGFTDDAEAGTPLCSGTVNDEGPPTSDDALVNDGCPAVGPAEVSCADSADNDADGQVNDGCPQSGALSEAQFKIGTGSQDPCGNNGWPADVFSSGPSANKLNVQDITAFTNPVRILDTSPGNIRFSARFDLVPGRGAFGQWVNIQDITALLNGPTSAPPMFGNIRAFDKTCPWVP